MEVSRFGFDLLEMRLRLCAHCPNHLHSFVGDAAQLNENCNLTDHVCCSDPEEALTYSHVSWYDRRLDFLLACPFPNPETDADHLMEHTYHFYFHFDRHNHCTLPRLSVLGSSPDHAQDTLCRRLGVRRTGHLPGSADYPPFFCNPTYRQRPNRDVWTFWHLSNPGQEIYVACGVLNDGRHHLQNRPDRVAAFSHLCFL